MGDKITLLDWSKYAGGLDIKRNRTGTHSYYTNLEGNEIMFHVSTLLPLSEPEDEDSEDTTTTSKVIAKKVHIGNDIVCIIFNDGESPFSPDAITSQFNHVFIVVQKNPVPKEKVKTMYRVTVAYRNGVQSVHPEIPAGSLFEKTSEFRQLILTKVINSERSAYRSASFADSLNRMRSQFLLNLHQSSLSRKLLLKEEKKKKQLKLKVQRKKTPIRKGSL